ncbi:two-component system response regulator [[Actinomadura] parvosata subsp. kistnae]|nr:two-component system response regulator [Actinomadura parvosata subsp. kistnae]
MIADDEDLIRAGLRIILGSEPDLEVVGEAADGAAVLPVVRRERPDVVLMDVRMPALDGIRATERLLALDDPPKVLVVTTFENDDYVYDALRAGASGFLLKRTKPDDLVQAVRLVAAGTPCCSPPRSGPWRAAAPRPGCPASTG